jgi:predicted aminopeptidase
MRRILAVLAICLPLGGCYLMQAASGQLDVLARSRPIDDAAADPATTEGTRAQLALVVEVSIEPRRWCFPIAGCVSYLGFFDPDDAHARADRLAVKGDDVSVGGVATYSTLGHLPDPVFNTMLAWREPRLLGTIFHELTHEQLYVADDTEFNEAYASVVATAGIRRWYAARAPSPELAEWERQEVREREFAALLAAARGQLARLYASDAPEEAMRIAKDREFGRVKFEYAQLRARWGGYAGYDAWFGRALNNAHLAAVATYEDCVPGLTRELEAVHSLQEFYVRARAAPAN